MTNISTPVNKIVIAGTPSIIEEQDITTATGMKPGVLVKKGSTDDGIVVCTASDYPTGVLGYEQTSQLDRPADIDTLYTVNKRAKVLSGGGFIFYGWLAAAAAADIVKGDPLVPGAAGTLDKGTTDAKVRFYAAESKTSSGAIQRLKVEMV